MNDEAQKFFVRKRDAIANSWLKMPYKTETERKRRFQFACDCFDILEKVMLERFGK